MAMAGTALITGASSGIGLALAKLHAQAGGDVVLVARSKDKLEALQLELEADHGIRVTLIAADLATPGMAQKIFSQTESADIRVDCLINNAGFGGYGKFHERDLQSEHAMMQVNMVALVDLTHLYMRGMVHRGKGRILHVASTAGMLPGPLQAVYFATKAFVVSFSQALAEELSGTGVTSTALCPGAVDTGFAAASNLEDAALYSKPGATAAAVATFGYKAMLKGKLVAINDPVIQFMLTWVIPLLPRKAALKISRSTMEKS